MHKLILKSCVVFLVFFYLISCQEDEICIDPITPKLTITFRDKTTLQTKSLDSINVFRLESSTNTLKRIFKGAAQSKIEVNLNVSNETSTVLEFSPNYNTPNKDILTIDYENEDVFISKACGFKRVYKNVSYALTQAIVFTSINENTTEIIDESQTHLYINW